MALGLTPFAPILAGLKNEAWGLKATTPDQERTHR